MRRILLAIFLILPVLVPAALIAKNMLDRGSEWELPIAGYDPRDLLRGRYILFTYDVIRNDNTPNGDYVACLNGDRQNHDVEVVYRTDKFGCDAWVYKNHLQGQQRYYIPESIADRADALTRTQADRIKALVEIKNGRLILKTLLIDGVDIAEYIRSESVE